MIEDYCVVNIMRIAQSYYQLLSMVCPLLISIIQFSAIGLGTYVTVQNKYLTVILKLQVIF